MFICVLVCLFFVGIDAAIPLAKTTIVKLGIYANIQNSNGSADSNAAQSLAGFLMAVDEINNNPTLLPTIRLNVVLGMGLNAFGGVIAAQEFLNSNFTFDRLTGQRIPTSSFINNNPIGVDFVVGAANDVETETSNMVLDNFLITQLHTVAQDSKFSLGRIRFGYKIQNVPVDSFAAQAWQEVVCNHFKWTKLAVLSTTDINGVKSSIEVAEGSYCQIDKMTVQSFDIGTTDFSLYIENVKKLGAVTFAVFCPPTTAGMLLEQMYDSGLLAEGTQVFGSRDLLSPKVIAAFQHPPNPPASRVKAIMRGILVLDYAPKYALHATTSGQQFVKNFKLLPNTVAVTRAGLSCNSSAALRKDDAGRYMYRFPDRHGRVVCAGLDYSTFDAAGTNMYAYAAYAYDAVYSYAAAIQLVLDSNSKDKNALTGDNVYDMLVNNVTLKAGATGFSRYFAGMPEFQYIAAGDREEGLYYSLHNFQPDVYNKAPSSGGFVQVGLWTVEGGLVLCTAETQQLLLVEGPSACATSVQYRTLDNRPPPDIRPDVLVVMDAGLAAALVAIGVVLCAFVVFSLAVVVYFRASKIMKASQPMMVSIILFGCLLGGLRVITGGLPLSDGTCNAWFWLGHLSFNIVFAAMSAKLWRVDKVVNTKSLKRIKVSEMRVVIITAIATAAVCVYLMISTVVGWPHLTFHSVTAANQTVRDEFCNLTYSQFQTTLFVLEGAALVYGTFLCYKTKDVPDAINEAKSITSAIVLLVSVCAVTFPVVFLIDLSTQVQQFIQDVAFAIATFGVVYIVYAPKIYVLLSGGDVDIKTGTQVAGAAGGASASVRQKAKEDKESRKKNAEEGDGAAVSSTLSKDMSEAMEFEKRACLAPIELVRKATYAEQAELCNNQIAVWKQLLIHTNAIFHSNSNSNSNSNSKSAGGESSQMGASVNLQRNSVAYEGSLANSEAEGAGTKMTVRKFSLLSTNIQ